MRIGFVLLTLACSILSANGDEPKDNFGDPLPKGAKARLGPPVYRAPFSIRPLAVSPDGKWIAVAADGGGVYQLIRADTGRVERELEAKGVALELVGFSGDSRRLAAWWTSSRGGGGCRVWEVATGKEVGSPDLLHGIHRLVGESVSLSADGRLIASTVGVYVEGNRQLLATVWEVESGKEVCSARMLANGVTYSTISPDGKRLATWGTSSATDEHRVNKAGDESNQIVQIWDVATSKEITRLKTTSFYARKAAFSPDGKLLVTGGDPLEVWDTTTGKRVRTLLARQHQGKAITFSPDGKTLAAVGHTGWVELWEIETGRRTGGCHCADGTPLGVVFAAGVPPLAYGQDGQSVRLWKIADGQPVIPTEGHTSRVVALAFSADNRSLVSVGADSRVLRWDVATGRQSSRIALHDNRDRTLWPASQELLTSTLFTGGKRLAVCNYQQTLKVYDLATGHEEFTLHPGMWNGGEFSPVAVSPDGRRLASFGARRNGPGDQVAVMVMVWDAVTGDILLDKPVDSSSQRSVAFTADGSRVVASVNKGMDYEVISWEVGTGKPLGRAEFPGHKHSLRVTTGPDDRSVILDLGDGQVVVWDVKEARTLQTITGAFPSGKRPSFVVPAGAAPTISPDGTLLAIGAHSPLAPNEYLPRDGIVRVLEVASGRVKSQFSGHRAVITALVFSPDGKTLASGSEDATVLLWDLSVIKK